MIIYSGIDRIGLFMGKCVYKLYTYIRYAKLFDKSYLSIKRNNKAKGRNVMGNSGEIKKGRGMSTKLFKKMAALALSLAIGLSGFAVPTFAATLDSKLTINEPLKQGQL